MPKPPSQRKFIPPARTRRKRSSPLWRGPLQDGITQSMMSAYLCCSERFRIRVIEGLGEAEQLWSAMEYGNLWHECEAELAAGGEVTYAPALKHARQLIERFPLQSEQVDKLYRCCKIQFPIYVDYWKNDPEVLVREPIYQEVSFKVNYLLPSGRSVTLRGKWDAVDRIGDRGVWLQENKTKTNPDLSVISRQLGYDLQVMTYLTALYADGQNPKGVRYNVVRRPLSGGKGTIKRKKATKSTRAETKDEYYARLKGILVTCPEQYFTRHPRRITKAEVGRFRRETLDPLLENLLDDYEWWSNCLNAELDPFDYELRRSIYPLHSRRHFRLPYGCYNSILEGGTGDVDNYIATGSTAGLVQIENLFPELDEE